MADESFEIHLRDLYQGGDALGPDAAFAARLQRRIGREQVWRMAIGGAAAGVAGVVAWLIAAPLLDAAAAWTDGRLLTPGGLSDFGAGAWLIPPMLALALWLVAGRFTEEA